jgi:carbamoyltransferase
MSYVVGVHFGHDASIAIVGNGQIIHLEKERFTRQKHDSGEIKFLYELALDKFHINKDEISCCIMTGVNDHFNAKRTRKSWSSLMEIDSAKTSYFGPDIPCYWIPHHTAHMAYAFYCSPFEEADIIAIDGIGDPYLNLNWTDCATGHIVHDFGSPYWKWAAYQHEFLNVGRRWDEMASKLFGNWWSCGTVMAMVGIPENNFRQITGFSLDIKNEIDKLQMETTITFLDILPDTYPVAMSGGCSLNGIANYAVLRKHRKICVPPAAHDGGLSVGAALYALHVIMDVPRAKYSIKDVAFCGITDDFPVIDTERIVDLLISQRAVPFVYGRAESGPRALGHRSIIADPRSIAMRDLLNRIKGRQPFRPTAPSVLRDHADKFFELIDPDAYSYMTIIAKAKTEAMKDIPAAIHYDQTARIHIVDDDEPLADVISEFYNRTGIPVLLNTSLNTKSIPIANTYKEAKRMAKEMGIGEIWSEHDSN